MTADPSPTEPIPDDIDDQTYQAEVSVEMTGDPSPIESVPNDTSVQTYQAEASLVFP